MPINNKIEAIKRIREIGPSANGTIAFSEQPDGKFILTSGGTIGLKEAKDLVESIMALGVREYKAAIDTRCTCYLGTKGCTKQYTHFPMDCEITR